MPTLAQIFEPALPSVPATPWVETWITGSGFPGAAAACIGAIFALVVLRRMDKSKHAIAACALFFVVAGAILLAGRSVVTPRELLTKRTGLLLQAAGTGDAESLQTLLHPDVRVRARFANAQGRDRVIALSDRAKGYIDQIGTKDIRVDFRGSQVARTLATVRIQGDSIPRLSQWTIDWQRPTLDSEWVVVDMEPIWIQGLENPVSSP